MLRWSPSAVVIALLLSVWAPPGAFSAGLTTRDWAANPAIVQIATQPENLYAIGDVHGDYKRLLVLLRRVGLIGPKLKSPEDVQWTGGKAVLVQTGDMIDKGPHPVKVLRLLAALRTSAQRSGGQVVITMGNHEAEFLAGPNETKARDFLDDLKRNHLEVSSVLRCQNDIGEFLCALPFGAVIGDWFFSHGGNSGGRTVAELSVALEQSVQKDGFGTKELADPNSLLEARLGEGKIWFHPSAKSSGPVRSERETLAAAAAALGVSHIAQGHQPSEVTFADGVVRHKGEMFQRWGLLFLIDTGLSRRVNNSKGAVLYVAHGAAVAICPGGLETPLWDEATKPDKGRAEPCIR